MELSEAQLAPYYTFEQRSGQREGAVDTDSDYYLMW